MFSHKVGCHLQHRSLSQFPDQAWVCAGYLALLPMLRGCIARKGAPVWQLVLVILGVCAIIYAGLYLSQVERRFRIVHFRKRVFAVSQHMIWVLSNCEAMSAGL